MSRSQMMLTPRFSTGLENLRREMSDLMERSFGFDGSDGGLSPQFDVSETDEQFEVSVDLPGMKAEDFSVEFSNGELRISGERKSEREEKGKTWHRVERSYGSFHRGIPLTEAVKSDKIKADYKDGVLHVTVPKDEKSRPKRIAVSS